MHNISDLSARLADPNFYLEPDFQQLMHHLRQHAPVHWSQAWPNRGFWSVTRYADIRAVAEQPILFSTEAAGIIIPSDIEFHLTDREAKGFGMMPAHTDPPKHDEVRRLFARHFAGPAVAKLERRTQEIVDGVLAAIPDGETVEFVMDAAAHIPARLICEMLGVPEEDWPEITHYTKIFASFTDPEMQLGATHAETFHLAMSFLFDYLGKLILRRVDEPRDDLLTAFAQAQYDGASFPLQEAACWAFAILAGGFETSRNILTGGLRALVNHPDQMALLRDTPGLIYQAIDEIVRWTSPIIGNLREAIADTEIAGQPIARGDWLVLWWHSGNRDDTVFDDPDRFDITVRRKPSLSFGHGTHNCIGRMVALLEARILFRTVLERARCIEITGPVEYSASLIAHGPARMPVRFHW